MKNINLKFNLAMITLIVLNVIAVILETVDSINEQFHSLFYCFEVVSVVVFSIEYFIRLWYCTKNEKFKHPIYGRIRYMLTPMAIIDLISILPFYVPLFSEFDLRYLRAIRLFRLFSILKLGHYSSAYRVIGKVLISKKEYLVLSLISMLAMFLFISCSMYFIENEAQPQAFSSIPATMWWAIMTLTTVGYGDIYPVTPLGKMITGLFSIIGIGLFALPAGILAAGFSSEIDKKKSTHRCPYSENIDQCPLCNMLQEQKEAAATMLNHKGNR